MERPDLAALLEEAKDIEGRIASFMDEEREGRPIGDTTVGVRAVQRAVLDLHRRTGNWPTIPEVARYLSIANKEAGRLLLELRRSRVMVDRHRKSRRVWMPWREGQR